MEATLMKIIVLAISVAFVATASQDAVAQSRMKDRPNFGYCNGKRVKDITKCKSVAGSTNTGQSGSSR
jgi:hypothetical protein